MRGGIGRGASGGARNIDPRSAPSTAPSPDAAPDDVKKLDVISMLLALAAPPPLAFFFGRATDMKRETRRGNDMRARLRRKRDADLPAFGARLAIW